MHRKIVQSLLLLVIALAGCRMPLKFDLMKPYQYAKGYSGTYRDAVRQYPAPYTRPLCHDDLMKFKNGFHEKVMHASVNFNTNKHTCKHGCPCSAQTTHSTNTVSKKRASVPPPPAPPVEPANSF
ncbi:hypothetical protein [Calycomorphotria hydatis]|nr:hypothetical protein [Calycomorphotria hydatis]